LVVIPVYVIISSLILNNPYCWGYPLVEPTLIVVVVELTNEVVEVSPERTSGVKLSSFMYWSRFSAISVGPP